MLVLEQPAEPELELARRLVTEAVAAVVGEAAAFAAAGPSAAVASVRGVAGPATAGPVEAEAVVPKAVAAPAAALAPELEPGLAVGAAPGETDWQSRA